MEQYTKELYDMEGPYDDESYLEDSDEEDEYADFYEDFDDD